jgi:hypothetical protein
MKVTIEIMLENHARTPEEVAAFDTVAIARTRQFMDTLLHADIAGGTIDRAVIITTSQGAVDLR